MDKTRNVFIAVVVVGVILLFVAWKQGTFSKKASTATTA